MSLPNEKNLELGVADSTSVEAELPAYDVRQGSVVEIKRTAELQNRIGVLRAMRKGEEWLDAKLGIELQGVDRIPEDKKQPPSTWNIFLMWWSLNVNVGVVPLGILGPEFGLSLKQSIGASIIGTLLGALCTAFTGTLAPKVFFENFGIHMNK